jgi:hypothetical protein
MVCTAITAKQASTRTPIAARRLINATLMERPFMECLDVAITA